MTPEHRDRLYESGLCRSCELPLLDEELAADARNCGVCRAVRARAKAMKRSPDKSPQEVNAYYAGRIAAEQAKRRAAGLPDGGRTSRDVEHVRRRIRCARTLRLIDTVIDGSNPQEPVHLYYPGDDLFTPFERRRGLPIGNLTSQLFANVHLDGLDHFVKEVLRAPGICATWTTSPCSTTVPRCWRSGAGASPATSPGAGVPAPTGTGSAPRAVQGRP